LLKQAKDLGCEMVHIAARGEPTKDPLFPDQLRWINKLKMTPVIFTHGGNIDDKWAKLLWENNASVIVKIHSFDRKLQDFFASTPGYTDRRDQGLKKLMDQGFNKTKPTRLGADILVMKKNYAEIEDIFIWCRKNNIFPLVKPFLCNERGKSRFVMENLYLNPSEVKKLYYNLAKIDREMFGFEWTPMPPYAAINCNYYLYHILVTIMGDVWPCIGLSHLEMGNIREKSLKECWESEQMEMIRNIKQQIKGVCRDCPNFKNDKCYGCPCRRTYLKGKSKTFICNSCWGDNL
jgi:MoaA/NifB/PqqE/SkfB family radical SAM enzyme